MHTRAADLYSKGKIHTSYFSQEGADRAPVVLRMGRGLMNAGVPASVEKLRRRCAGVTMVELAAVIAIMGILAGLGVSKLQGAIANANIKDATYNVTAFMERTANEARRLSTTLCVQVDANSAQKLVAYSSSCASVASANRVDSIVIETPNRILADNEVNATAAIGNVNFATSGAEFRPKQGLSAAPPQGFFAVQYGGKGVFGASVKLKDRNSFIPMMKFEDTDWSGI